MRPWISAQGGIIDFSEGWAIKINWVLHGPHIPTLERIRTEPKLLPQFTSWYSKTEYDHSAYCRNVDRDIASALAMMARKKFS